MQALGSTIQSVQQTVETYRSAVHASAQSQGRVVEQAVARLAEGGATCESFARFPPWSVLICGLSVRSDASTSRTTFDDSFAELVSDTRTTYATCQQNLNKTGEDVDATTTSIVDAVRLDNNCFALTLKLILYSQVDSHWMHGGRFVNSSTRHLEDLRSDMKTYLETDVRADVPTGTTPRKREWPKDRLLPIVDLDGDRVGVRQLLLQAKHGRRIVEVVPTPPVEEPASPTEFVLSLPQEKALLPPIKVLGSVDMNSLRSSRSRSAKGSK